MGDIFDRARAVTHTLSDRADAGSTTSRMAAPAQALHSAPVPPQNLDAEESVLGAMMLNATAIGAVTETSNLSAADFYRESHGHVYKAILSLYAKGEPVDAITVVDELDRTSTLEAAGGADRIHELAALVPAASNAGHYARIVSEMATLRGLIRAGNDIARHERPVALFTLEMSKSEVTQRLMCSEGKVESQRLRTGKLAVDDWPRLTAACDKLAKAPIYVDDTASITMMEIRSKLRRLKMKEPNLGLVIVDYLQLMTSGTSAENRVQEVSQISRALKVLARDLDVPIIALSQLSRAVEQRHDKRPILSDLRESGSIEQDADLVMFVYRDEYYNPEDSESAGIAELI